MQTKHVQILEIWTSQNLYAVGYRFDKLEKFVKSNAFLYLCCNI